MRRNILVILVYLSMFGSLIMYNVPSGGAAGCMDISISGIAYAENGKINSDTYYNSQLYDDSGFSKNLYKSKDFGQGGKITTVQNLSTTVAGSGDVEAMKLGQLVNDDGSIFTKFHTEEMMTIGEIKASGEDNTTMGGFQAGVDVGMNVHEGMLSTDTHSEQGTLVQSISGFGTGSYEFGVKGEYTEFQGPAYAAGLPMHDQICPWYDATPDQIFENATQKVDSYISLYGEWTFQGGATLKSPKAQETAP